MSIDRKSQAVCYGDTANNLLVVWCEGSNGAFVINGQLLASADPPTKSGVLLNIITTEVSDSSDPPPLSLAYDATGNRYILTYVDSSSGQNVIKARAISATGVVGAAALVVA